MLALARNIAYAIRTALRQRLACTGYHGDSLKDPGDLKSPHRSDEVAIRAALAALGEHRAAVYIESEPAVRVDEPEFSLYLDPLDGSLNWDRGIGDPGVVIALSPEARIHRLDDLSFAYVLGLRSGDEYWTEAGRSHYRCALTGIASPIAAKPVELDAAVAYLRPGYGQAEKVLKKTKGLQAAVRDIRAVDNTGVELCEIARGAAHLMAEVRELSDVFNLLAWPILRNAGGRLIDLDGKPLADQPLNLDGHYDYIAASSLELAMQCLKTLHLSNK